MFSSHPPAERTTPPALILIVEDDADVRQMLEFNLRTAGFEVIGLESGATAADVAEREEATLVILDRMLGGDVEDGLEVCRRIRQNERLSDVAVLILTARGTEHDRVDGFAAGADDYVVKPFSVRELVARARVLTTLVEHRRMARRAVALGSENVVYRWRQLILDVGRQQVLVDGVEADLRPIELALLLTLFKEPTRIFSRADIVACVWGDQVSSPTSLRTVDVHVRRLRERLGPRFGEVIQTVHGSGYKLREQ